MKLRRTMKAQSPKKKKKERNNNNKKRGRGPRLGQVGGHIARILVRLKDIQQDGHQGPKTLMCPFEALRREPWLTYGKALVHIFAWNA